MTDLVKQLASVNWVVSLVSGVVLSILGRLLATYAEKLIERSSAKWAERRRTKAAVETKVLQALAASPFDFGAMTAASGIRVLICFGLASAVVALANVNERYMSDTASDVLTALGTLLYLVSVFLGFDVLRRIARVRELRARATT
jgi:hypothetical protein